MRIRSGGGVFVGAALVAVSLAGCALEDDEVLESVDEQGILGPPATVTVTATAPDRATVSWTDVPGAVKYYVYMSQGPAGPFTIVNTARAPSTSLAVAHLNENLEYCFEVRTEDGTGPGAPSTPACTTTPTGPSAPNAVQVTQTQPDRVSVAWTTIAEATKYYIYEATSLNGTYTYVNTALAPANTLTLAVPANTTRCYRVATFSPNGTSIQSPGGCNTGIQPPTAITATRTSSTRISLAWTAAANASKYYVYESRAGAPLVLVGSVLATSPTSLARANLTTGVQYCYQIRTEGTPTSNISGYSAPAACATP